MAGNLAKLQAALRQIESLKKKVINDNSKAIANIMKDQQLAGLNEDGSKIKPEYLSP